MAILKGASGDLFEDGIAFAVEVLLGSKYKTGGIDKAESSVGGRGKLRSGRKLCSGSNLLRAVFREGEPRARAQGIVVEGNRAVFFRDN